MNPLNALNITPKNEHYYNYHFAKNILVFHLRIHFKSIFLIPCCKTQNNNEDVDNIGVIFNTHQMMPFLIFGLKWMASVCKTKPAAITVENLYSKVAERSYFQQFTK